MPKQPKSGTIDSKNMSIMTFYFANYNNKKIAFVTNILFTSFIFHLKS